MVIVVKWWVYTVEPGEAKGVTADHFLGYGCGISHSAVAFGGQSDMGCGFTGSVGVWPVYIAFVVGCEG